MATKNNIRSIRFSDELAELIERQQGENFTQKFENLVYRCAWELPAKERELKQLEERIQEKREQLRRMSAQAVGGAVGRNPISIVIPCHRLVGADGGLTGYAAGVAVKARLLALEGHANLT